MNIYIYILWRRAPITYCGGEPPFMMNAMQHWFSNNMRINWEEANPPSHPKLSNLSPMQRRAPASNCHAALLTLVSPSRWGRTPTLPAFDQCRQPYTCAARDNQSRSHGRQPIRPMAPKFHGAPRCSLNPFLQKPWCVPRCVSLVQFGATGVDVACMQTLGVIVAACIVCWVPQASCSGQIRASASEHWSQQARQPLIASCSSALPASMSLIAFFFAARSSAFSASASSI